jgi:hypothetical protein
MSITLIYIEVMTTLLEAELEVYSDTNVHFKNIFNILMNITFTSICNIVNYYIFLLCL